MADKYVIAGMMNAKDDRFAEFDTWYTEQHVPGALKVPGISAVTRYEYVPITDFPAGDAYLEQLNSRVVDQPDFRYMSLIELSVDPNEVMTTLTASRGNLNMGESLLADDKWLCLYRVATERQEADVPTSTTTSSARELGVELARAVSQGDIDALSTLFSPSATIWHGYDGIEQSPTEMQAMLLRLRTSIPDLRYEDVQGDDIAGGFVQQQVLCGTRDGVAFRVPGMFRAWVVDGVITRVEEYLDPSPLS